MRGINLENVKKERKEGGYSERREGERESHRRDSKDVSFNQFPAGPTA